MRIRSLIISIIFFFLLCCHVYADEVFPAERDFRLGKEGIVFYFSLTKYGKVHVCYSCLDNKIWHDLCRENVNLYPRGVLVFAREDKENLPSVIVQLPTDFYGNTRDTIQLSFHNTERNVDGPNSDGNMTINGSLVSKSEYQKKSIQIGNNFYAIIGWKDDAHCILVKYYPVEIKKHKIHLYNAAIYKVSAKKSKKLETIVDDFIHSKRVSKELTRIKRTNPHFSIHYISPTTK